MNCNKVILKNITHFYKNSRGFAIKAKPYKKKKYTHTIKLPKTEFRHWLSPSKRVELDEYILKHCGFSELYCWQRDHLTGPEFILHDGPPYANGVPHMGHAINKILKDIINRSKIINGTKVNYKPGWDCHGLPIELKALEGQVGLDAISIREKAQQFANKAINDQRTVFKAWGLMADWQNNCYYTFDPKYMKNQIQQFYNIFKKKLIFRDLKPVYWSPSSRTALAEAELEYKSDHVSKAVTVALQIVDGNPAPEFSELYLLIWTTTPWSLPANEAVAFNPAINYSVVELNRKHYILCSKLVDSYQKKLKTNIKEIKIFTGDKLSCCKYKHPVRNEIKPVLAADYVTDDVGTGLVHTAPSHGPDDYLLALKCNLPIVSYIDELGNYTKEAGNKLFNLRAMDVGVIEVLKIIGSHVIHEENVVHSYPYDWRTKKPVMLRASKQWFIDTTALKHRAIGALKDVKISPERNIAGLLTQIENRPYWCISRQRAWGVPIPVLYDENDNVLISEDLINHYLKLIDEEGTNFWWKRSASELIPSIEHSNYGIEKQNITKSLDILDIWLDSGLSWSAVLNDQVADLYLEGIDQFTGWFQSSLLTSVALADRAPYRAILAHGFAVDGEGRKMSKSLGNVINPQDITHGSTGKKSEALGIDVLRWWVAGHSLQHTNIPVSRTTLEDSLNSIKKIRNSLKFLLGALHDLPLDTRPSLRFIDQYMLIKLDDLLEKVNKMYTSYEFNKICVSLLNFSTNDLSSFYCTSTKDRLYCGADEGRKAVQFTMNELLHGLLRMLGPILPVLTEEVFLHHPHNTDKLPYFQGNWKKCLIPTEKDYIFSVMSTALVVRDVMMKEKPVNIDLNKLTCSITAGEDYWNNLNILQPEEVSFDSELTEILQVPMLSVSKGTNSSGLDFNWKMNNNHMCERCWKLTSLVSESLCQRCSDVLNS